MTVASLAVAAFAVAQPPKEPSPLLAGRNVEAEVFEGVGVAGVEFGDPSEFIVDALGEPDRGSEQFLSYASSGLTVTLREGKASGFSFTLPFRGALATSGLRLGSNLAAFEKAYGAIEKSREVDDLERWRLDRTLLVLTPAPTDPAAAALRLHLYDVGICVDFDGQGRARTIVMSRHTGYADNSPPGGRAEGRFVEEPVSEAGQFAGVRFGDTREQAIEILGKPISQNDYFLRYPSSRFSVHIRDGKVDGFLFDAGFRGKLVRSKLGVGASLTEVQAAFGAFHLEDDESAGALPGGPLRTASLTRIDNFGPDLRGQFHAMFRDSSVIFSISEQDTVRAFRIFKSGR